MLAERAPNFPIASEYARQTLAFSVMLDRFGVSDAKIDIQIKQDSDFIWLDFAEKCLELPFFYDASAFEKNLPTALGLRQLAAKSQFVIFDESPSDSSLFLWSALARDLEKRSPYQPAFTLICPNPDQLVQEFGKQFLDPFTVCSMNSPQAWEHLLAADAALVNASRYPHNLLAVAQAKVPAATYFLKDQHPTGVFDHALAVSQAQASDLANLLLLLSADPLMRRSVLRTQDRMLRKHTDEQQGFRCLKLLAALGIAPRKRFEPQPPEKRLWRVEGVFDSSYSLAIVNRNLAMALARTGQAVSLLTYEQGPEPKPNWQATEQPETVQAFWHRGILAYPPAVSLRNAWPPLVKDMRGDTRVLASYAWEESGFPAEFVSSFNQHLDLITVVSGHVKRVLRDAGVATPIALVGNGVDHLQDILPESIPRPLTAAGTRFLHISSCFPRKGVDVLLRAYGRAFRLKDDVSLVIKTFPNPHNTIHQQLEEIRKQDPEFPKVDFISEDWSPSQIVGLYKLCHVFVLPSRAEGFGLPIAEAMLHELPVITTAWGGHLDFCSEDTCWLLDYELAWAKTHMGLEQSVWAEPDELHLADLLRGFVAMPVHLKRSKLQAARNKIADFYAWDNVAQRTVGAIEALARAPLRAPQLKVAWVSTWASRCGIAMYSNYLVSEFQHDALSVFAPVNEIPLHPDSDSVRRVWALGATDLHDLVREVIAQGVDAVVIQYHWAFFSVHALAEAIVSFQKQGIQVLIDMHNTLSAPPEMLQERVREAFDCADRILVHTLSDLRQMKRLGLVRNVALFPLAVYPQAKPSEAGLAQRRHSLGLEGKVVLATYGFLMPHKGLVQMVQAFAEVLKKRPDAHLLMVNAAYSEERSGPELSRIRQEINRLSLANNVTLITDFLADSESALLLGLADLIVFPYQSTQESSSAAVRMALACDRPVAVTPLPFFDDVNHAVAVLPGSSSGDITRGVLDLLEKFRSPDFFRQAVSRSQEFAAQNSAQRLSARLRAMVEGYKNDREAGLL